MAEYIKRDWLMKERHGCNRKCAECDFARDGDSWCKGEVFIVDVLRAPAADVVEVVRCADCRCFQINMRQDGYLPEGVPECECRWWCGEVDPTDYCSHAKRKDGGQDDV